MKAGLTRMTRSGPVMHIRSEERLIDLPPIRARRASPFATNATTRKAGITSQFWGSNGAKWSAGQLRKYAKAMALATDIVTDNPNPHSVETTTTPSR